ncbi:MAG: hypothetical protein JWL95_2121 [Gemmatimonadetes bacterium]|nr:hypothetical protein [Gemmatimonadota bacterium]
MEAGLGANVRWGLSNNFTLNGTVNPDFSQIESDEGQLQFDPRQALFFAEKRPFFLDGTEYFATPKNLVYTRRIVQPVAAGNVTGKVSGFSLGVLSAVDGLRGSTDGKTHPVYTLARAQRDFGANGKLGVTLTDRTESGSYNRVASLDARRTFASVYSAQAQYAQSFTRAATGRISCAAWPGRHGDVHRFAAHREPRLRLLAEHAAVAARLAVGVLSLGQRRELSRVGAGGHRLRHARSERSPDGQAPRERALPEAALRAPDRWREPLLVNGSPSPAYTEGEFRSDFLVSYRPNPGSVLFMGYGAGYADTREEPQVFRFPRSLALAGLSRTDNVFYVRASYLYRL